MGNSSGVRTVITIQIDEEQLREECKSNHPDAGDAVIDDAVSMKMSDADRRVVKVLGNRFKAIGLKNFKITPDENHHFTISARVADDNQLESIEKSIISMAFLRFRLVHPQNSELVAKLFAYGRCPEGFVITDANGGKYYKRTAEYDTLLRWPGYKRTLAFFGIPRVGYVFMLEPEKLTDGSVVYTPTFVRNKEELTGAELARADIEHNPTTGEVQVGLSFKKEGAARFAKLTSEYCPHGAKNIEQDKGRQLAIILDDTLYSAPVIREPIPSGRDTISGNFSKEEAILLRNILNAGALPVPLKILEIRKAE